mgnify:CR=1 FL=1
MSPHPDYIQTGRPCALYENHVGLMRLKSKTRLVELPTNLVASLSSLIVVDVVVAIGTFKLVLIDGDNLIEDDVDDEANKCISSSSISPSK